MAKLKRRGPRWRRVRQNYVDAHASVAVRRAREHRADLNAFARLAVSRSRGGFRRLRPAWRSAASGLHRLTQLVLFVHPINFLFRRMTPGIRANIDECRAPQPRLFSSPLPGRCDDRVRQEYSSVSAARGQSGIRRMHRFCSARLNGVVRPGWCRVPREPLGGGAIGLVTVPSAALELVDGAVPRPRRGIDHSVPPPSTMKRPPVCLRINFSRLMTLSCTRHKRWRSFDRCSGVCTHSKLSPLTLAGKPKRREYCHLPSMRDDAVTFPRRKRSEMKSGGWHRGRSRKPRSGELRAVEGEAESCGRRLAVWRAPSPETLMDRCRPCPSRRNTKRNCS